MDDMFTPDEMREMAERVGEDLAEAFGEFLRSRVGPSLVWAAETGGNLALRSTQDAIADMFRHAANAIEAA